MNFKITTLIADLSLLSVNAIWGFTFVTMKQLLEELSVPKILLGRFLVATVCLLGFSLAQKWDRKILRNGGILGLALFAGYFFQTWGLRYTTPARSAFVTGLSALLVPFFVYCIFRRKIDTFTSLGIVTAILGLLLLTVYGEGNNHQKWWGDLLTALGACAYALQIVLVEKFNQQEALPLVTAEMATVTTLSFLFFHFSEDAHFSFSLPQWGSIIFLGIMATALAFTIQKFAQKHTSAARAGLVFTSEPVFAAIFSYFLWHERFTSSVIAGCTLILGGILLSQIHILYSRDSTSSTFKSNSKPSE